MGYFYGDDTPEAIRLRESVLWRRLKLVDDLIINLQPEEDCWGTNINRSTAEVMRSGGRLALQSVHRNTLNPGGPSEIDLMENSSAKRTACKNSRRSLFRDDVDVFCLTSMATSTARRWIKFCAPYSVSFRVHVMCVRLFGKSTKMQWLGIIRGIGVLEGYGISSTEWRCE